MGTLYDRAVLNDPVVSLAFSDPLSGLLSPSEVTLELSNADGYFDARDVRGERLTYSRFDKLSNETWAELTGRVVSQEWRIGFVRLRTLMPDLEVLQTLLPKEVVTAATFPKADPQQGLGKPIPIVFGTAASTNKVNDAWELPWVGDDSVLGVYDYLVGRGSFTNISVYRDFVGEKLYIVPATEYTVNTTAYPGFTAIRFTERQRNFSGGFHRIFAAADVSGTDRRFSTAIKFLLNDATQGLGQGVDAANFTAAAADLDAIGNFYCDGVITERRAAQEYLRQLLMVRGMTLDLTASGTYTLTVDKAQSVLKGRFGHGIDQSDGGVQSDGFEGLQTTPVSEAIKTLILDYRLDRWSNTYLLPTSPRSVLSIGAERREVHDFIRDRTTADKVASYLAKRLYYADDQLPFLAGQMARRLRPGELISYTSTQPAFDKLFTVQKIDRELTKSRIFAVGWSQDIFTYAAGTLPSESAAQTETDWSRSAPTAVTNLAIASQGTEADGQGGYTAFVILQYNVPVETWAETFVRYRRSGAASWETAAGPITTTGAGIQTKITGLITGLIYDYQVSRVNSLPPSQSTDATLSNQVAPGDLVAPSAPTAIAVRQGTGKDIEIDLTFTEPADWRTTELYRNTSDNSGTATLIETKKAKRFHDVNISFGTPYYYWAKVRDYSGNVSGFSPSSFHSITPTQIADTEISGIASSKLIGSIVDSQIFSMAVAKLVGQITTPQIADSCITTVKIVDSSLTTQAVYAIDDQIILTQIEQEVGTVTVTTNGGWVSVIGKVMASALANAIGQGKPLLEVRLRKDAIITGQQLDKAELQISDSTIDAVAVSLVVTGLDTSPSPTQTYKLGALIIEPNTIGRVRNRRMIAVNFKK